MQNNAPAGIRTRVAQLGTVHDNPYTTGAHYKTSITRVGSKPTGMALVGIETPAAWDRNPDSDDRDRNPGVVGIETRKTSETLGIETQESSGSKPAGTRQSSSKVRSRGIEPRPPAWKAGILATELRTLHVSLRRDSNP